MKFKPLYNIIGAALIAAGGVFFLSLDMQRRAMAEKPPIVQQEEKPASAAAVIIAPEAPEPKPFKASDKVPLPSYQQYKLREIAAENDVPYIMALAVIEVESTFDPSAENDSCYGLMQIHTVHAPKEVLLDPISNMRYGCYLLGAYHRKYKAWHRALVVYNCGERGAGNIQSSGYSRKVIMASERWAQELGEPSVLYGEAR